MTVFRQDAKQVAENIAVYQCKFDCPHLTPIARFLFEISAHGIRNPKRLYPDVIQNILNYGKDENPDALNPAEMGIRTFAQRYETTLAELLELGQQKDGASR